MGFIAFVKSAKRLKRARKKPRKRKLQGKIAALSRKNESVRAWKQEKARRLAAGETGENGTLKLIRITLTLASFGLLRCWWKGGTKKKVAATYDTEVDELVQMDNKVVVEAKVVAHKIRV
jgi:delta 1-pyrroline-5-carboxylate dehydrogenase